jgi:hypothetical protein
VPVAVVVGAVSVAEDEGRKTSLRLEAPTATATPAIVVPISASVAVDAEAEEEEEEGRTGEKEPPLGRKTATAPEGGPRLWRGLPWTLLEPPPPPPAAAAFQPSRLPDTELATLMLGIS